MKNKKLVVHNGLAITPSHRVILNAIRRRGSESRIGLEITFGAWALTLLDQMFSCGLVMRDKEGLYRVDEVSKTRIPEPNSFSWDNELDD